MSVNLEDSIKTLTIENICTEQQHEANTENTNVGGTVNAGDDDTKQLKELLNEFDLYEVFPYLKGK